MTRILAFLLLAIGTSQVASAQATQPLDPVNIRFTYVNTTPPASGVSLMGTDVGTNGSGATINTTYTVPADGTNTIVLVHVSRGGSTGSVAGNTPTFAGQTMTVIENFTQSHAGNTWNQVNQAWYLVNPPAGSQTFNQGGNATDEWLVSFWTFEGVDQTTPVSNSVSFGQETSTCSLATVPGIVDGAVITTVHGWEAAAGYTISTGGFTRAYHNSPGGGADNHAGAYVLTDSTSNPTATWVDTGGTCDQILYNLAPSS